MASWAGERRDPRLAINAFRIAIPKGALPAALVPYDRAVLHGLLDREPADLHAIRRGDEIAVIPLTRDATLPAERQFFPASEVPFLVAALAREAVLRELTARAEKGYRITKRRPLVVEAGRPETENVLPASLGLPDWLKKRMVLEFDARVLVRRGVPSVILTCSNRVRTIIEAPVRQLRELGVPLLGATVSTVRETPDPKVSDLLRYAGRILAVDDDGTLTLEDQGDGPVQVPDTELFLEPSRTNFAAVVAALTQGRSDAVMAEIAEIEAASHAGPKMLGTARSILGWLSRQPMQLADGVPLIFEGPLDQSIDGAWFPPAEAIFKPKLMFDPGGASGTQHYTPQKGLDEVGPYDRESFGRKKLRIAVVCEAARLKQMQAVVGHFLHGLPHVRSKGPNGLVPHGTGLVGRFRLEQPEVRFFTAAESAGEDYTAAALQANEEAAGRDVRWDLALLLVSREWMGRPYEDSPYWMGKAAFLKQGTVVQSVSVEMIGMREFEYACSLASMALQTYAKLGGLPWLLPAPPSDAHEFVFGLGSHVEKRGRRGAGQRVVGIATVFTAQGAYVLDSRTSAVSYDGLPDALRQVVVEAVERIRADDGWLPDDRVRLVFHAFTQLGRDAADAVVEAVGQLGLKRMEFAFLHVVEDHPFTVFDLDAPADAKAPLAPERGQAIDLGDREWLVTLVGRKEVKGERQGMPDPVLLRLHDRSTYRNMRMLARQVGNFACHTWRNFGSSRLPVSLSYAEQVARQLAGLERTPNWDPDAVLGNPVMRRPWFL